MKNALPTPRMNQALEDGGNYERKMSQEKTLWGLPVCMFSSTREITEQRYRLSLYLRESVMYARFTREATENECRRGKMMKIIMIMTMMVGL